MTATSRVPRAAARTRATARRVARACAVGAVVLAVALSAVLVPASTSAPAQAADPTPAPSASGLSGQPTLTLSPTGRGIVPTNGGLSVTVTLDNGTAAEIPEGTVSLSIGTAALADRAALSSWLSGEHKAADLVPVVTSQMAVVPSGGSAFVLMQVPRDDTVRAPGVYPLLASFDGPDGPMTSASVMIVADPVAGVTRPTIGVVVPITAGPLESGMLTAAELETMTAPSGQLTALLDAVEGTTVILAVDPAILASIRAMGTSAPQSATAWLDRLGRLANPRFALQFGDADIVAQIHAGHATLTTPLDLSAYVQPENFPPAEQDGATPAPTPTPAVPDTKTLTDLGIAVPSTYWPFTGTADAKVLSVLRTADPEALTLVGSASTKAGAGERTVTARARIGGAPALVYDTTISKELAEASTAADPQHSGNAIAAATAHLVFAEKDAAGVPLLVTVDREAARSFQGLRSAIEAALGGAIPADLRAYSSAKPIDTTFGTTDADAARTRAFSELTAGERKLHDFSTILDDPAVLNGPERAQILQLIGGGWLSDDAAWVSAVAAHQQRTEQTLDSVSITAPEDLLVLSSSANLRFYVHNGLQWPVNVTLHASPDSPRISVAPTTDVRAGAASNTPVIVPVSTRGGNGEVAITLSLTSPTGVEISEGTTANINVRAEWEALGFAGLGLLVVTFLALGAFRMFLRGRRTDAAPAPAAGADAEPAPTDDPPQETD